jgi:hypothetical protein
VRRALTLCSAALLFLPILASAGEGQAHKPTHKAAQKPAQKKAAASDEGSDGFLNLYVEICVRHFGELEDFRARLLRDKVPKLPAQDAKLFLSGMEGDAWPVPYKGKMGNFVLALPAGKNLCLLHARRANAAAVEKGFLDIVAEAPKPMVAKRGPSRDELSAEKIKTHTVSTTWAPPGARRRMEFMLTTTASNKAELQALGSVAMVADGAGATAPAKAALDKPARPTRNRTP